MTTTTKGQLEEATERRGILLDQANEIIDGCKERNAMTTEEEGKVDAIFEQVEDVDRLVAALDRVPSDDELKATPYDSLRMNGPDNTFPFPSRFGKSPTARGPVFKDGDGKQIQAFAGVQPMAQNSTGGEIGEAIHNILRGEVLNAQVGSTDSAGGYIINPEYSTRFIDLARSASVCMRAGAVTLPMTSSELVIAGLASDPTSHWRAETVTVPSTDIGFNRLTLRAKTLAAIVPVSIEMLEDATNAPQIIESAIQASMGQKLDAAGLTGYGAAQEPKGIQNTENVNSVGSIGTPANYDKPSSAVGKILQANYPGGVDSLAWITHPRDGETFDQLKDTTNQPLMKPTWVSQLRPFSTTALPTTLGGSNNESLSIVGDFSQLVFGMRKNITFRILDSGSVTDSDGTTYNATSQLMRLIVAYMRVDVAVLRPTWFTNMDGITA